MQLVVCGLEQGNKKFTLSLLLASVRTTHTKHGLLSWGRHRDGTLAQSLVPDYDYRIPYAMETHGVVTSRLRCTPEASAPAWFVKWCSKPALNLVAAMCNRLLTPAERGAPGTEERGSRPLHGSLQNHFNPSCTQAPWPLAFAALGAWQSPQHH